MATHFIVQTATAHMPPSVKHLYRRVAILEVDEGVEHVSMISARARGCHRVVALWDRLHVGATGQSAYRRTVAMADIVCAALNADRTQEAAILSTLPRQP